MKIFHRAYRRISAAVAATDANAVKLRKLVHCQVVIHPQSAISLDDAAMMQSIAKFATKPDHPRFVVACRLEHWKAVDLAIRVFPAVLHALPDATLEIIGRGPEESRLKQMVKTLGMESHVRFHGRLPHLEDVYREIAGSTALVHPALHESFGQVCLEAVALGIPFVCWDHGGPGLIARQCGMHPVPIPGDSVTLNAFTQAIVESVHAARPRLPEDFLWPQWCKTQELLLLRTMKR